MHTYAFRLLNVFADTTFGGNPLCVFEDARGLDDQAMLDLARQFNLSETTFILPAAPAHARVRIFTPASELRFAGHPTLVPPPLLPYLAPSAPLLPLAFSPCFFPVSSFFFLFFF